MDFLSSLDWAAIIKIIGIDIMLGVDNAIVIALACAALPLASRKSAILMGTFGAVALRIILLGFASLLMGITGIKLVAGAYLLYIWYSLLVSSKEVGHSIDAAPTYWWAIRVIIIADFMMSLDNVLAVTWVSQGVAEHGTLYAIAGVLISIPIIIFAATGIMRLMDRYPIIIWIGGGLLGWVGAEMMISDTLSANVLSFITLGLGSFAHLIVKITGFLTVITLAYGVKKYRSSQKREITP